MKNFIFYLFSILTNISKCHHTKALLNSNEGYCPDCGIYLKKYYYVLRCSCCSHKREASRATFGTKGEVIPISKYCPVCGGAEFYIEKYEKLNLVDINYAIEVKEEYEISNSTIYGEPSTKVWVEIPDDNIEKNNTPLLIKYNHPIGAISML